MADSRITDLTALTGANTAPTDVFVLVDVSDTTMGATGTDKKITRQELQTYNAGTLTTDVKVLDLSATWNAAGVAFTGFQQIITRTAYAAGSRLFRFGVTGDTNALTLNAATTLTDLALTGGASASCRIILNGNGGNNNHQIHSPADGTALQIDSYTGGVSLRRSGTIAIGFTATASAGIELNTGGITYIHSPAANTFEQRNGTNAQTFNLYRSYTDASNYQRLKNSWNTSTALIMNEGAGTGADGNIAFNDAALATTATKGYIMIPSCAGAPTGVPADIPTGQVALHYDSTNNQIYVYNGAWKATAALA